MDEREARELVSNLSYYEKLILREMLKGLLQNREPEAALQSSAV